MSKEYFLDLRTAPRDVVTILGGVVAGFGLLDFVGFAPASPPLALVVHKWREISHVVWRAVARPFGLRMSDYLASALTFEAMLLGLSLWCMWRGHRYYGRVLLGVWPWSEEFENRTWWSAAVFWVICLYSIGILSLTFDVPFGASHEIPRDLPHDAVRLFVGCVAVGAAGFPGVVGSTVMSLLVLVACDALIPILLQIFREASAG